MIIRFKGSNYAIGTEPTWVKRTSRFAKKDLGFSGQGFRFTLEGGQEIVSHNVYVSCGEADCSATAMERLTEKESAEIYRSRQGVAA